MTRKPFRRARRKKSIIMKRYRALAKRKRDQDPFEVDREHAERIVEDNEINFAEMPSEADIKERMLRDADSQDSTDVMKAVHVYFLVLHYAKHGTLDTLIAEIGRAHV